MGRIEDMRLAIPASRTRYVLKSGLVVENLMKQMSAIAFKARCLKVMDDVQASREPVLITKRGKPVVKIVGDIEAPIDDWNALKRYPRHRKNSRSKSTP